jgi:hypothetical protein
MDSGVAGRQRGRSGRVEPANSGAVDAVAVAGDAVGPPGPVRIELRASCAWWQGVWCRPYFVFSAFTASAMAALI